ncbi:MAG: hypothetical protein AAF560_05770 [Acidobacteriota bacterium]
MKRCDLTLHDETQTGRLESPQTQLGLGPFIEPSGAMDPGSG